MLPLRRGARFGRRVTTRICYSGHSRVKLGEFPILPDTLSARNPLAEHNLDCDNMTACVQRSKWHVDGASCFLFLGQNRQLLSIQKNGRKTQVWSVADQVLICESSRFQSAIHAADCVSNDGLIVLGGGDPMDPGNPRLSELAVWDMATDRLMWSRRDDDAKVHDVALSTDQQIAASVSASFLVRLWSAESGELVQDFAPNNHHQPFSKVVFSADGNLIAAASIENVYVWDRQTGELVHKFAHDTSVSALAFSPAHQHLVSFSIERGVVLHDVVANSAAEGLRIGEGRINCLAFSPNGRLLLAGGGRTNGKLWCWQLSDLTPQFATDLHDRPITSISIAPGGDLVSTAADDQIIAIWELE